MNLKKNDKIIAVVGVIILIIAGISIAVVISSEEKKEDGREEAGKLLFDIYTDMETVEQGPESYSIAKKLLGKGVGEASVNIGNIDNLKSVDITVSYNDAKTGPLGRFADEITITITDPEGNAAEETTISGSGNVTLSFFAINNMISTEPIEAESWEEAEDFLEGRYVSRWKNGEFNIKVDYKMSEPLRRPILRLLERLDKDTFSVEISYTYYSYGLLEEDEIPPPIPPGDDQLDYDSWQTTLYSTISLPGRT